MEGNSNQKSPYDLEERTFVFAQRVKEYTKRLPRTMSHIEYIKQLLRSSGSVAANWIEAVESLSKKDFLMRVKICRKEAKESILWLRLTDADTPEKTEKQFLMQESTELMKIFGAIITKN